MVNHLQITPRRARSGRWAGALALLAWLLPALGHAQSRADAYGFTQSTGTYTAITGTVISTASDDNVVYPATTLPFTFTYAGTAYTTLRITSNGYITFGATAPGTATYTPISSTTGYDGAISAFGLDGGGRSNTGAAISTSTEGTAPNREFVVQYANWGAYGGLNGVENYQIRLVETSNVIRIVYGSFTGLGTGTNPQVGLRGAAATDFNNRASAVGWDQTNTGAALTSTSTVAVSATLIPASGLTYTYTPSAKAELPAIRPTTTAVTGNSATVAFVAPAAATAPTSYTATVTPAVTGSPFTVTASPFTITGLAANTPYAVSIVATYATGASLPTETRLVTATACAAPTALTISAITTTSASLSFTAPTSGVANYTVTTTPATNTYTITDATTAAPLVLTGLTAGTPYTVNVVSNCSVGGVAATATTTFTTAFACVTPTYATLPYTQTFENTWVSNCALRDVPSLNWKLTPGATDPDASFRRYDDGVAGNWTGGSTNYGYTPAGSNAGGATSAFSARYHSGNVSPVTEFALFDLYANAGGSTGTPTLTFDYINTSGSDKIEVLLSTDGGATFGTPLFTQILAASWTTYTVPLTGATATSIIRFRATGDNGSTDIGLDNVNVSYVTCSIVASLGVANITATTANVTFTAPSGGASYTVTYTPAGGTATTVTPAPTASPVPLTGLTPNTTYTVSVTTNCAGSTTSAAVTTTFTTACVAAPYVALPYTQTFESTWANACGTRDVPDANWRSSPLTGNNAWRRFDDGTAGGWSTTSGAYTPAGSNAAGATSSFSARFHSYNATAGSQGQLDLYANVSGGTGTATLTFDYINTSGTDKLEVLLSTDGGATFSTTPLFSQVLAATWTPYTVALTGATATSIIRFRATGDDGLSDIGLDNVSISYVTCAPPTTVAVPAANITTTTAQVTFTASPSTPTSYTVTTLPATTQANATTSPITLTGLTPGTTYTVTLTANCSGSSGSSTTTAPVSFTTAFACVTPTYATLPYTQTFENTWVSNCALRDVPSLNWKLTPGATDPDASFRRYDDGVAGNWTGGSTNYGYTPAGSNAGGATSAFSARYHSGNVSPVTEFALFDLYANAGGSTGTPTLTFDYINTSGSDKIEVLLSTDGGATFGTPLFTQILAASWTTYTVPLTGATATSIIRFRATGDNGSSDIGLDNVGISYVACAPVTALAVPAATITTTTAQVTFTAPASGSTSYTVTTVPTTTQANATTSPITLTGLTPGTSYTVTLTANCTGGGSSTPATATFTTAFACVTPTYATLPYTQTFENTWVSNCALREVPSLNWKMTAGNDPDASFRRYDDGAAANWTSTSYGYTPAGSNAGGASSLFSARYHSGNVFPVTEFALFDLYANISAGTATSVPTLKFDYINTSGSDKIEVLLSTDGGATFSTTPLFTQVLAASWTTYTVPLTGATATSIIRFRATGDNGSTDIGLDNVNVSYVVTTATTTALTATGVSVYPNPAHESFTVRVPAVANATSVQAELLNALGQVVRKQSVALPAAGASFTVPTADLATGVYTLRLRAGDASLAKRVVIN
ncbi:hypothetical protein GCM10028824_32330 [Hymenobacter segetis]|uniref:Fibronectin type III domain-containing protein n=1 Tax=Hymenobacter segetis TaxID=2025509 RepID=A0ABU9LP13_9BACT